MSLLLDTSVIIDVLRGRRGRREFLLKLVSGGHTLSTCTVNIGEVYAGLRRHEEARTEEFLSSLDCFPLTREIAKRAGLLRSELSARGKTKSLADMIVAATAMAHGLTLLTDNTKDFPMAELKLLALPPERAVSERDQDKY